MHDGRRLALRCPTILVATLLAAVAACRPEAQPGADTGVAAGADSGFAYDTTFAPPPDCDQGRNPGIRDAPPFNGRNMWAYVRRLCFDTLPPAAEIGRHPNSAHEAELRLSPERRMLNTRRDQLQPGHGMVIAELRNLDGVHVFRPGGWNQGLGPRRTGYVWIGRNGNGSYYSAVLTIEHQTDGAVAVQMATGGSGEGPEAGAGLQARWTHPPTSDTTRQTTDSAAATAFVAGAGWVSCLRGCCTLLRLFES